MYSAASLQLGICHLWKRSWAAHFLRGQESRLYLNASPAQLSLYPVALFDIQLEPTHSFVSIFTRLQSGRSARVSTISLDTVIGFFRNMLASATTALMAFAAFALAAPVSVTQTPRGLLGGQLTWYVDGLGVSPTACGTIHQATEVSIFFSFLSSCSSPLHPHPLPFLLTLSASTSQPSPPPTTASSPTPTTAPHAENRSGSMAPMARV